MAETDDHNDDDEFEAHEFLEIKDPINNCEAFMNILRGCVGSGLLALPISYKYSGMVIGTANVILTSILLIHTLDTLVIRKHFEENQVSSFVFIIILQFGNCMSYVIVGASCLETFFNNLPGTKQLSRTYYIMITMVPYFLTLFIMNLKSMAPVSLAANITMFIVICLSLVFLLSDMGSIGDRDIVTSPKTWYISMATVVFSMQAIGVVSHVEYNMKTPQKFSGCCGVFPLVMYILTVLYVLIGFLGYWKYGNEVRGNFILNLPPLNIKTRIIQVLLFLTMLVSYGLNAVVAVDTIWEEILERKITKHRQFWNFLLKIGVLLVTHALTIALPRLPLIASLTGVVSICTLSIIYPMLMEIYERYDIGYGQKNWILVKDIFIILIGVTCFGLGLSEITLEALRRGGSPD